MAAGLGAFQGVDTSTDAQKAALTQMIGQMGSEGANAFKADAAVAQQAAAAGRQSVLSSNPGIGNPAASSAVGPGALTQLLAGRAAEPGLTSSALSRQAASDFGAYSGMLGKANGNYMDAVKGAAPIVASQTAGQVAGIQAELAYKRAQLIQDSQDRALAAQQAAEDRKWELTKRGWEISDRNAKNGTAGAQPRSASDVGKAMGLSDEQVSSGLQDKAYTALSAAAKTLIESSPEMDYNQLVGQLTATAKALKDDAGNPLGGTHVRALALVLAQMAPLVGGTKGGHSLDKAYNAYGMNHQDILDSLAKKRADTNKANQAKQAQHEKQVAAAKAAAARQLARDKAGIPRSFHGTIAEWNAMSPEVRTRVYGQAVLK